MEKLLEVNRGELMDQNYSCQKVLTSADEIAFFFSFFLFLQTPTPTPTHRLSTTTTPPTPSQYKTEREIHL